MMQRQKGALLLMVALLLATVAALAFGLNQASGIESRSIKDDYDGRAAGYLAEAAFAAAKWRTQVVGCPKNKVANDVPLTSLGAGSFQATAVGDGSELTIAAAGAIGRLAPRGDALRTIERARLKVHDFTDLEVDDDDFDDALDTTIAVLRTKPDTDSEKLSLMSNQSHALLYWSVDDMDKEDKLLSAILTLTLVTRSATPRTIALHRMTTRWDANATWTNSRANTSWTGTDYSGTPLLATVAANSATASWDITNLVEAWSRSPASNAGILLRLADTGPALDFYSRKAGSSNLRPTVRVIVAAKC